MDFLLIGGQPNTGKSETIFRIAENLNNNTRFNSVSLPNYGDDFSVVFNGSNNNGALITIFVHSATDDASWIDILEKGVIDINPDIVITSIRDIDWQRRRLLGIVGGNFVVEVPLARITRRHHHRGIALNWYRNSVDNNVNFVLGNNPFDL